MVKHLCPFENCSLSFSRPYRLRIHIQRHRGIKEFGCPMCDRGYHRQQHLQRHIVEAHQNQPRLEEALPCDHCDRLFNTKWGLQRHQARIKNPIERIRRHCCKVCGKKFFTNHDLDRHSLRHDRFKCDMPDCPLSHREFNWLLYSKHMEKYHCEPYSCEHCNEQFLHKSQIRIHVTKHMPCFPCTEPGCNKTFALNKNLLDHIKVGHGERIYKCDVVGCDWDFKYKICYKRHIKLHETNGKIVPMVNRKNNLPKKKSKPCMAEKLASLALKYEIKKM
ncbi:transcription factor IIIA-like [Daktulosphaira vitifoliae]|uniref:transcription factor IIIA-like n=1 Tax=Daktulosphaira vitifoliae TaxID=58002 RepID=UPI0021A9857C|nr:transcription factor IIIA-like [Daktulosphaira vitifoliae]